MQPGHRFRMVLGVCLPLVLGGCGATLLVNRMPADADAKRLDGLVVNQNEPHSVIAVFPKMPGGSDLAEFRASMMLPSNKELYVIGYRGQLFTTRNLEVELHPDTTLKRVKVGSEAFTEEAFADLTSAAAGAAGIKAIADADKTEQEEQNEDAAKDLCANMLQKNKEASEVAAELPYPTVLSCP